MLSLVSSMNNPEVSLGCQILLNLKSKNGDISDQNKVYQSTYPNLIGSYLQDLWIDVNQFSM